MEVQALISRDRSRVPMVITLLRALITLLVSTREPPRRAEGLRLRRSYAL